MSEVETICAGLDLSSDFKTPLDTALGLARSFDAKLWLVTVLRPPGLYERLLSPVQSHLRPVDEAAAKAAEELEALVRSEAASGVSVDYQVQVGAPFADLIAAARTVRAQLLVVGTHARSGVERLLLGSTAERVLRKSPMPVLIAKKALTSPPKVILASTDFSDASRPAVEWGARLARCWDARLQLLHAIEPLAQTYVWPSQAAPMELFAAEPEDLEPEWAALLEKVDLTGIAVDHRTLKGYAAPAIVETAKRLAADLVVMGTHGRSGLLHMLLGSVAEQVAREAPVAVMTVRPDEFRFELP
jgi:nucleotide-binding universal stress UspA family protein